MRCSNCGNFCSLDDNFCRKCGASLRNVRVPAARDGSRLPVVWRGAMPVVAQGVALFALSAVAQMLVRMLARRAVRLPSSLVSRALPVRKKGDQLPVRKDEEEEDQPESVLAFRETVLLRRIVRRR